MSVQAVKHANLAHANALRGKHYAMVNVWIPVQIATTAALVVMFVHQERPVRVEAASVLQENTWILDLTDVFLTVQMGR